MTLTSGGGGESDLPACGPPASLETIDVCIWCMFVFMSVVVTVWWFVGIFVV